MQFPLFLISRFSYANSIPSKVPFDTRVELLETYWEKDDNLGTRLCLAGIGINYKETKIKMSLIEAAVSEFICKHFHTPDGQLLLNIVRLQTLKINTSFYRTQVVSYKYKFSAWQIHEFNFGSYKLQSQSHSKTKSGCFQATVLPTDICNVEG